MNRDMDKCLCHKGLPKISKLQSLLCGVGLVHNGNSVVSCDLVLNITWQQCDLWSDLPCRAKVILTPAPWNHATGIVFIECCGLNENATCTLSIGSYLWVFVPSLWNHLGRTGRIDPDGGDVSQGGGLWGFKIQCQAQFLYVFLLYLSLYLLLSTLCLCLSFQLTAPSPCLPAWFHVPCHDGHET